jgi:hypothetical protein
MHAPAVFVILVFVEIWDGEVFHSLASSFADLSQNKHSATSPIGFLYILHSRGLLHLSHIAVDFFGVFDLSASLRDNHELTLQLIRSDADQNSLLLIEILLISSPQIFVIFDVFAKLPHIPFQFFYFLYCRRSIFF